MNFSRRTRGNEDESFHQRDVCFSLSLGVPLGVGLSMRKKKNQHTKNAFTLPVENFIVPLLLSVELLPYYYYLAIFVISCKALQSPRRLESGLMIFLHQQLIIPRGFYHTFRSDHP